VIMTREFLIILQSIVTDEWNGFGVTNISGAEFSIKSELSTDVLKVDS